MFKVQYGSIYNEDSSLLIAHLAIVVNRYTGLRKYGDKYMHEMLYFYDSECKKLRKRGVDAMANNLIYFEFDRYEGLLTIEETCTLLNHLVYFSMSRDKIIELLSSGIVTIKDKISEYVVIHDTFKNKKK